MKVLVIGAAGNVGQRVVFYLLSEGHTVTAFVRSRSKLVSILSPDTASNASLKIIEGDAVSVTSLTQAIRESDCDALMNCAGMPAILPWNSSTFPAIGKAVTDACLDALGEGKRVWMLAGLLLCDRPGGGLLMDSANLYPETRVVLNYLQMTGNSLNWAILCAGKLEQGDPKPAKEGYDLPPGWPIAGWLCRIPGLGFMSVLVAAATQYTLSFDSIALWMVQHLEDETCRGKRVALRPRS